MITIWLQQPFCCLQVRWFFKRRQVKPDANHRMEEHGDSNYTLTVRDIKERHLGIYTCSARNKIGEAAAKVALKGKTPV